MTIKELLRSLKSENIKTWFDLSLFLDRVREKRKTPVAEFLGFYEDFREYIQNGGIGFITFDIGIDGVSIEISKYVKCFRKLIKNVPIHFIVGEFNLEGENLIDSSIKKYVIKEMKPFNSWRLYKDFFLTKLERGSKEYNRLIKDFWEEVLLLIDKLGNYIVKNKIKWHAGLM